MNFSTDPRFFETAADFRRWLEEQHDRAGELWVGFYKVGTGRQSRPEAVDEALCFGWIDGIRKAADEESYTNRFTPRRAGSSWSAKNVARIEELIAEGRVAPSGLAAYEKRSEAKTGAYSYEQRHRARFSPELAQRLRAENAAWEHFQSQPPGYRKLTTFWVMSAKREETRRRRMGILIESSRKGRRIPPLDRSGGEG